MWASTGTWYAISRTGSSLAALSLDLPLVTRDGPSATAFWSRPWCSVGPSSAPGLTSGGVVLESLVGFGDMMVDGATNVKWASDSKSPLDKPILHRESGRA